MKGIRISTEDRLFSEFIRRRALRLAGGCERCLTPKYNLTKEDGTVLKAWKQLSCCHLHSRGKRSVRWDEDNAIGLCGACHMYFHGHPLEQIEFYKAKLGEERFEQLQLRAEAVTKLDMAAVRLYLNQLLKSELQEGKAYYIPQKKPEATSH